MVVIAHEGKHDARFLEDIITHHFNKTKGIHYSFYELGGITNLRNTGKITRLKETAATKNLLVIVDADKNFSAAQQSLNDIIKNQFSNNVAGFLMPNNKDNGNLESLLFNIVDEKLKPFFSCFDTFQQCLNEANVGFTPYDDKARINALLSALQDDPIGAKDRVYTKPHWDLDHPYLKPLVDFLYPYFK